MVPEEGREGKGKGVDGGEQFPFPCFELDLVSFICFFPPSKHAP